MNQLKAAALGEEVFNQLKENFIIFFEEVLGLLEEPAEGTSVLTGMLSLYSEYKANQEYDKVDEIRSYFKNQGLVIRDMKHRVDWAYEE
jgi:cysteinyl-tRNA synthetase